LDEIYEVHWLGSSSPLKYNSSSFPLVFFI